MWCSRPCWDMRGGLSCRAPTPEHCGAELSHPTKASHGTAHDPHYIALNLALAAALCGAPLILTLDLTLTRTLTPTLPLALRPQLFLATPSLLK